MRTTIVAALAAAVTTLSTPGYADSLQMHSLAEGAAGGGRPERGLAMNTVRERYGEPAEIVAPVGEPPITRWVFAEYTVYFEHDRVIHSVIRPHLRASSQP